MTSALVASTNTYFVGLEDALGSIDGPVVQTAEAMGMHFDRPRPSRSSPPTRSSRTTAARSPSAREATSPLDLASAYATVAASGTQCDPTPVTAILDQNGQPLKDAKGNLYDTGDHCTPNAIAPGVANTLANMMVGVVSPAGTGRKAIIPGHTIGGKTGTTQDNNDGRVRRDHARTTRWASMYFDPTRPGQAERRRRRRRRAGADLPRRDGADPGQPARPPVPAGRPGGRGRHPGRRLRRRRQRRRRQPTRGRTPGRRRRRRRRQRRPGTRRPRRPGAGACTGARRRHGEPGRNGAPPHR